MAASEIAHLREADLTYPEVGLTRGDPPTGYQQLRRRAVLGVGRARFEECARILLGWDMHRRAGVSVRSSSESVAQDGVAVLGLGPRGPLGVTAPVRVVHVIDEDDRQGFAYGTLPGHPERGEESFLVELHRSGQVTLTISALSRPESRLARVGGPVSRVVQRWITHRYLRALADT